MSSYIGEMGGNEVDEEIWEDTTYVVKLEKSRETTRMGLYR